MTQMVLANGPAPAPTEPARASSPDEKTPFAIRAMRVASCAVGLLFGLQMWMTTSPGGLVILCLFTIASLAHAWFQSRRGRRTASAQTAATTAAAANQGEKI